MFPFSFAEVFVYAFSLFWLFYLILFLWRMIFKPRRLLTAIRFISIACLTASIVIFLFTFLWGLNYISPPLSQKLGLDIKKASERDLADATNISLRYANEYSGKVKRNTMGKCSFGSFSDLSSVASKAIIKQIPRSEYFNVSYCPGPKAVYFSPLMSYFGITGIYFPFTGESNVNTDNVTSDIPFVMTHELSHRLGIAREDEANFMAFLACTDSSDPDFVYSGYLSAYIYTLNALYDASPDTAKKIIIQQSDYVTRDIKMINEWVRKYEGPASHAGEKINNTYLKSMGQKDGVRSYGRMVDLLIAYYNSSMFTDGKK
ncbi:MAG: DUF3810 domain-containing protein [Bacillota bacterium]|nr:DUF3810 domain-containing protein [Bacillota bacterium]